MKNKFLWVSLIAFLAGCTSGGQTYMQSADKVTKLSVGRVSANDTLYTEGLKCVGKLIEESGQSGQITASVGKIDDKTGKEYDTSSKLTQASPDMALTALGTIGAVDLIGITDVGGLAQVDTTKCNVDQVGALGSLSCLGSQFFLTGAISEYNKDIRNRSWGFTFFRKLLDTGLSSEDSVVNVAMDLRLVASSGKILRNSKKELLMVSLQNNIVTRSMDGSLFRTWTSIGAGVNFALKTNDPQHLAIREIIDRGTLILVGKLFEVDWQKCDIQKIPETYEESKKIAAGKNTTGLSKDPGDIPGMTVRAANKAANWSKSLISKLEAKLSKKQARNLYVSTSNMKDQKTDYFEGQLLAALRANSVFKPRPGNTVSTPEIDKMKSDKLREQVESSPGLSLLAALLGVDSQVNWQVKSSGSDVTVTVFLVDGKTQKTVSASETFAASELPKNVANNLDHISAGIISKENGKAVLKPDLAADFVTTHGKGSANYDKAEDVRFLVRLNRSAYTYFFLIDSKAGSVTNLYPNRGSAKKLDANKVWVFPGDVGMKKLKVNSAGQYMLLGIASEKALKIPANVTLDWLQKADQVALVQQGVNVGEYVDMGVMLQASR